MEEEEVLDFDKICRLCLLERSSMLRIFQKKKKNNVTPLPIQIMSCATLEILEGDGLPSKICPQCLWNVNQCFSFREMCEASNTKLLTYVHNMKKNNKTDSREQIESEMRNRTTMEFLDDHVSITEQLPGVSNPQVIIKTEDEIKSEPEDEDDKPISELINFAKAQKDNGAQFSDPAESNVIDISKNEGREVEENVDSESDLEADAASALVETEMREDTKPPTPENMLPTTTTLGILHPVAQPFTVRKYLEAEFAHTYNKKYYMDNTSDYSMKIKKKQESTAKNVPTNSSTGQFSREGLDQFNLTDLKPRRKYAPRERNLISNNSSPIIEQDGTKSKFRACTHCGKIVLGKNMGIHVKIHVGNKSHLCDICGKSFLYKKTLETHKRVHSGERPCVCKICNKTFRSSSRLSDHMSTHTGRKPFICEICAVAFRIKGHLKKHLRVHSGEKPYICHFCDKAFSDAWNMKCHLRIHTGAKPPHACPVCGQCFLRRNKMEEHCKLTHGEEYVIPRKQNIVQRLKNDLIEMNDELRVISQREQEDLIRQETERQFLASHFESQRQELGDPLAISVPMTIPVPPPAFLGNISAGIFGLQ